ncbi:acetyl-CoA synthetase [Methylacidimicrobium cyclopophantes]|uniref:Acetyl-coenzyme A synthetase n=1 Tax=Methylacidimicrobium cyclopophantes TaxID=1041766 RepID=A0A5E6M658_9BACT|nr:acetate--CoA ligase [Methylacidimicrobium cyclopophantes]VVM05034.1 acetyl-CoA synthetase [Methylacidimicrobium cyclopophantes]
MTADTHLSEAPSVNGKEGIFPPPRTFSSHAHIGNVDEYRRLYRESIESPETFWGRMSAELDWADPWKELLAWELPDARWFLGGKLNASYNCLDRHLMGPRRNKAAIVWEGEPGEVRTLTYQQLHWEVCRWANLLARNGVAAGDRVVIYLPMIPEAAIAMLACARLGAPHSVVFGGFSSKALRDRLVDCGARILITADGGYRRGKIIPLKERVNEALEGVSQIERVLVVRRTGKPVPMQAERDRWIEEEIQEDDAGCKVTPFESEHPLFILYTSGTTGRPKGILHTTAGYLLGCALTTKYLFDIKEEDLFWCTADVGWVTGHSYVVYGPLAIGASVFLYEGAPDFPRPDRFWRMIERHRITILYTAPTAIRAFMRFGEEWVEPRDLSSLRLLGSVGEPINPEAWLWYHEKVGRGRCPIVDTWWQTETGSAMIAPLPGATACKPGSASLPFFGVDPAIVDDQGAPALPGRQGKLVIRRPWPSMLRGIYGDPEGFRKTYWSQIPGVYFTGDGARQDKDGYFWITGRIDDVLNVSGHRIGTAEVESALVSHPKVAEAAVVGEPDPEKGEALVAFVTLRQGEAASESLKDDLRLHVEKQIGSIVRPKEILFASSLPKTRSGKIMRRLLKELVRNGQIEGDTTTLEDPSTIAALAKEVGQPTE